MVTGHLFEGSFVRNVVVQIPKFDAKPNPKPNPNLSPNSDLNPNPNSNPNPLALTLCLYFSDKLPFGQVKCYPSTSYHIFLDLPFVWLCQTPE